MTYLRSLARSKLSRFAIFQCTKTCLLLCAVLHGLPIVGKTMEFAVESNPEFDIGMYFEDLGEHFVVNLGPGVGYSLVTRNPAEIRSILKQADVFKMRWPGMLSATARTVIML